jgi:hypothetical protein
MATLVGYRSYAYGAVSLCKVDDAALDVVMDSIDFFQAFDSLNLRSSELSKVQIS